jgi:hypothetical protein
MMSWFTDFKIWQSYFIENQETLNFTASTNKNKQNNNVSPQNSDSDRSE